VLEEVRGYRGGMSKERKGRERGGVDDNGEFSENLRIKKSSRQGSGKKKAGGEKKRYSFRLSLNVTHVTYWVTVCT
jgi:hypothetical protein